MVKSIHLKVELDSMQGSVSRSGGYHGVTTVTTPSIHACFSSEHNVKTYGFRHLDYVHPCLAPN